MESHDYYARINGKDYPIAWGFRLTKELGETLDSGSITLPHVFEIISLKPYDDVLIHDYKPNAAPGEGGLPNRPFGKIFTPGEGHFYKHMLVQSFTREKVNTDDVIDRTDENAKRYHSHAFNYSIQLKSETAGLEAVQLPNRTLTQPMSVTEGKSSAISASFKFGGASTKYTLPYGIENSSKDNSFQIIEKVIELDGTSTLAPITKYAHYVLHVYIGDGDPGTADYSTFLTMQSSIKKGSGISLPDWSVSGVTSVREDYTTIITGAKYDDKWGAPYSHHPIKHWVVRKIKTEGSYAGWEDKSTIVARIKKYLNEKTADDEIVNSSLTINGSTGVWDISSGSPISLITASFPENGSYIIYLYCEQETVSLLGKTASLYGTTDNSLGTTPAPEGTDFLCAWGSESNPIEVSDSNATAVGGISSAYEKMRQAVELYSPYVKATDKSQGYKLWRYKRKYSLADSVKAIFSSVIAPENQWNCPNLRDFLTKLMYVKDCIPVVHDGVIECMSLSKRSVIPFDDSKGLFGIENYAMDGNSYCDRLIRTYNDGLSKDNIVKCVERIGFKNSDSPTLTLDSLRLEFAHPIYRITKILMCYYNAMGTVNDSVTKKYKGIIKHDITPLVLLNSQRNMLSEDWASLSNENPTSLDELAKYKYATVGYDIGSRYITGWGMKYTYPAALFWSGSKTVIENILTFAMSIDKYGSDAFALFTSLSKQSDGGAVDASALQFASASRSDRTYVYNSGVTKDSGDNVEETGDLQGVIITLGDGKDTTMGGVFSNLTQKLKSLFFIVEYEGYVSASVVASKDYHDGAIVSRDNASSSLSFVESDGVNQKEKVNRLGNAIVTQPVRYSNRDDVAELSQVWDGYDLTDEERQSAETSTSDMVKAHDDEVLYKIDETFERDYVQVAYSFCKNYVLRNYFTSVFAKRRPFALASYDESVERQENKTIQLLLSPDEAYYQRPDLSKCINYSHEQFIPALLTFFKPTEYDISGETAVSGVDASYYIAFPSKTRPFRGQCGVYATEVQKFTSGNSICFTIAMTDNASAGVFVSDWNPSIGQYVGNMMMAKYSLLIKYKNGWQLSDAEAKATDTITGSKQSWLMLPIDQSTGEVRSMRFGVGRKANDFYAIEAPVEDMLDVDVASYQLLPLLDAVVIDPDGYYATYFGGSLGSDRYEGYGAPRLKFKKDTNHILASPVPYLVDFSNEDAYFQYDDIVHELDAESYDKNEYTFVDGDGNETGHKKQSVRELMSAKFVASEDEGAGESETCVFKDGKERLSVTMQVEPVSEDNRVIFSDRMMKMSDTLGGSEKYYGDKSLKRKIRIMPGLSIRNSTLTISGTTYFSICIPVVAIAIPKGSQDRLIGTYIGRTMQWSHGQYASFSKSSYTITLDTIRGFTSSGSMVVSCVIKCSDFDEVREDVTIPMAPLSVEYIAGRTGASTFATKLLPFYGKVESGYVAYVMAEDGFFRDSYSDSNNHSINDFEYLSNTGSGMPEDMYESYNKEGSLLYAVGDALADTKFIDILKVGSDYSSTKVTNMIYDANLKTWTAPAIATETKDSIQVGYSDLSVEGNMFWALCPIMGSREVAYDVRSSMDDGDFSIIDSAGGQVSVLSTSTSQIKFTVVGQRGTRRFVSGALTAAKELMDKAFPDLLWEDKKVTSVEIDAWSIPTLNLGAITGVELKDDGTFVVVGRYALVFPTLSSYDARARFWVTATAKRKEYIPISLEQDDFGLWRLKITLDKALTGPRSIRLYHKEGSEHRFVFGANLGAKADKGKSTNVIYPSNDEGNVYYIYVSALDDRSKTVIDADSGDPSYKIYNWLDGTVGGNLEQRCSKKGS